MLLRTTLAITGVLGAAALTTTSLARAESTSAPAWTEACMEQFESAQVARNQGHLFKARRSYAACSLDVCPRALRTDCERRHDEVEVAMPTASFVVRDEAGHDLVAEIVVDDSLLGETNGRAAPIEPGSHLVTYAAPGRPLRTSRVTIHEGEKNRVVVLVSNWDEPSRERALPRSSSHSAERIASLAFAGVGLALAATSAYFFVAASDYRERGQGLGTQLPAGMTVSDACLRGRGGPEICDLDQKARTASVAGMMTAAAGAAFVAAGAILWLAKGKEGSAHVAPVIGPTAAGAALGMSF